MDVFSTVVANGTFPGPLISGNIGDNFQVGFLVFLIPLLFSEVKYQINVIDNLTDATMRRATSVVSCLLSE